MHATRHGTPDDDLERHAASLSNNGSIRAWPISIDEDADRFKEPRDVCLRREKRGLRHRLRRLSRPRTPSRASAPAESPLPTRRSRSRQRPRRSRNGIVFSRSTSRLSQGTQTSAASSGLSQQPLRLRRPRNQRLEQPIRVTQCLEIFAFDLGHWRASSCLQLTWQSNPSIGLSARCLESGDTGM